MNKLKYGLMENDKIKILWHEDYYDGPLSGFLNYNNKNYHFRISDEILYHDKVLEKEDINVFIRARIYYVYDLTKKEFSYYKKWNDYYENSKQESQNELAAFYHKREESYIPYKIDKNKIIGYFVDIPRTKDIHVYNIK